MTKCLSKTNLLHQAIHSYPDIPYSPALSRNLRSAPPQVTETALFLRDEACSSIHSAIVHCWFILWICLKGCGNLLIDNVHFKLQEGDAVLLFPGQPHLRIPQQEHVEFLAVRFMLQKTPKWLEGFRTRLFPLPDAAGGELIQLAADFHAGSTGDPVGKDNCALSMGRVLNALRTIPPESYAKALSSGGTPSRIEEICGALLKQPQQSFSLENFAEEQQLSPGYLRRLFKQSLGCTPKQLQNSYRMHLAQHLLQHSELSVSEIAIQCGYDSLFSFSRAFSHANHCSPTQYRNREYQT